MKIHSFNITKTKDLGLIFEQINQSKLYDRYHQHEEIQLSIVIEGEGNLLLGDTMIPFRSGTFIGIGSYLPHVFLSNNEIEMKCTMYSIFITKLYLQKFVLDNPELSMINPVLEDIKKGFTFFDDKKTMQQLFDLFKASDDFKRFILFLEILYKLKDKKRIGLSGIEFSKLLSLDEGKRLQKIFNYIFDNYFEDIKLADLATIANMTVNSFCKYFKQKTNKTPMDFLNEYRTEIASKQILNKKELNFTQIAANCGFNSISTFNRCFSKFKSMSPSMYQKKYFGHYYEIN